MDNAFTFVASEQGALQKTLKTFTSSPHTKIKQWIATQKVSVNGVVIDKGGFIVKSGDTIEYNPERAKPKRKPFITIVHQDDSIVVVDKPPGLLSVPYPGLSEESCLDAIRRVWKHQGYTRVRRPIFVVHRIDKDTSGLLSFALTKHAERSLSEQLRDHSMQRIYRAWVHGNMKEQRIQSQLVKNRGDGYRGSTKDPTRGKRAVSMFKPLEHRSQKTLMEVSLETGRTHQIRIHAAESGHPIVGEKVYIKDFESNNHTPIPSQRLMLQAVRLKMTHPKTGQTTEFKSTRDWLNE